MVKVDGKYYANTSAAPDLGSLVRTAEGYEGLNSDYSKLPTVTAYPQYKNTLVTGTVASLLANDGLHVYKYEGTTDSWKAL